CPDQRRMQSLRHAVRRFTFLFFILGDSVAGIVGNRFGKDDRFVTATASDSQGNDTQRDGGKSQSTATVALAIYFFPLYSHALFLHRFMGNRRQDQLFRLR
ncbi:MAG: hypothetical protein N2C12_02150, partial [Planctomycetales bacterium]